MKRRTGSSAKRSESDYDIDDDDQDDQPVQQPVTDDISSVFDFEIPDDSDFTFSDEDLDSYNREKEAEALKANEAMLKRVVYVQRIYKHFV